MIMYFAVLRTDTDATGSSSSSSRVRGDPARALQRRAGRPRQDAFPRLAKPRRGDDAGDLLLVQPDVALQRRCHLLHRQPTLAELPWHTILRWLMVGLALLHDQRRAVSGRADDRLQVGPADRRHAIVLGSILGLDLPSPGVFLSGAWWPTCCSGGEVGGSRFPRRVPDRRSVFLEEEADVDPTLADDHPERDAEHPVLAPVTTGSLNGVAAESQEPTNRRRRRRRRGHCGDRPNPPPTNPKHEDRGT